MTETVSDNAGAILDKIGAAGGDVFRARPVLAGFDWLKIVVLAMTRHRGATPLSAIDV